MTIPRLRCHNHHYFMRLNQEQHTFLQSVFISVGLSLSAFDECSTDDEYCFRYIMDPSICFTIYRSIPGKLFGDVFCSPYIYISRKNVYGVRNI